MKTVTIAAAQTVEFREDVDAALNCVADVAARAKTEGASLLCFPECFLSEYLIDETPARRNALDLASPAFQAVLNRLPKTGPMIVMGLIEVEDARLFNTAIVVDHGVLIGITVHLIVIAIRHNREGGLRMQPDRPELLFQSVRNAAFVHLRRNTSVIDPLRTFHFA